jgi:hypothetical protein
MHGVQEVMSSNLISPTTIDTAFRSMAESVKISDPLRTQKRLAKIPSNYFHRILQQKIL